MVGMLGISPNRQTATPLKCPPDHGPYRFGHITFTLIRLAHAISDIHLAHLIRNPFEANHPCPINIGRDDQQPIGVPHILRRLGFRHPMQLYLDGPPHRAIDHSLVNADP